MYIGKVDGWQSTYVLEGIGWGICDELSTGE